ncbi:uncharacterized protein LOC121948184 isoform X1 [Plectropomus leopardus]|uniref:uncharacterized protein LOC121948184 isoform X1 n=1 Tax=Plectropomus leopardus TaxID=160734 RepID=UPI001C4D4442|nr:uncharacterized protein LOC121948184 isoform X1 [Plectropomus leopardus]
MTGRQAALILLSTLSLIQTAEVAEHISVTVAEPGGSLTLTCLFHGNEAGLFYWYKLKFGYMVETVAAGTFKTIQLQGQFNNSRFIVTKLDAQYVLNITNVSKDDEATYFCQAGSAYIMKFVNSTLLIVNGKVCSFSVFVYCFVKNKQPFVNCLFVNHTDRKQQKSFYVEQSPETESVQLGDSVNLQCSLLSKNKENEDQCPGEHSVYWFRSGSAKTHPSIIYTHSKEREERSCFYSLSKTIQSSSDTGTYYCAVVTCGEILFGEGTKVETRQDLYQYLIVLGLLLGCCVIANVALIISRTQTSVCKLCKGGASRHDGSVDDQPSNVDGEAEALNYVALDFPSRNAKRWTNNRELPQDCLYSDTRDYQ